MASFSNPSKTYTKDKLSKCATMVLLVCCYLYRKGSNTTNITVEAKEQGRDMQTPIDDSGIFTEVSRSAQASPSPLWSTSQGPSSRSGNSVHSPRPSPHGSGSPVKPFMTKSLPDAPNRLHYEASGQNAEGLIPFGTR